MLDQPTWMQNMYKIQPQDLQYHWHQTIKPEVEAMIEQENKEYIFEKYITEDVYAAIRMGLADIFVYDEGNGIETFMIFRVMEDTWSKQKYVLIWFMWSEMEDKEFWPQRMEFARNYARENGCVEIRFYGNRPGWRKRAKDYGFNVGSTTYALRV